MSYSRFSDQAKRTCSQSVTAILPLRSRRHPFPFAKKFISWSCDKNYLKWIFKLIPWDVLWNSLCGFYRQDARGYETTRFSCDPICSFFPYICTVHTCNKMGFRDMSTCTKGVGTFFVTCHDLAYIRQTRVPILFIYWVKCKNIPFHIL